MKIKLNWFEVFACAHTGLLRKIESMRRGTKDAKGFKTADPWGVDVEGACGEMAVAKFLNRYWDSSVNTFSRGDVGDIQVRTSRMAKPMLIVQPKNNPEAIFVLASGTAPEYEIYGWLRGKEAMKEKYLTVFGGRPAVYAVPPANLHRMSELPKALK